MVGEKINSLMDISSEARTVGITHPTMYTCEMYVSLIRYTIEFFKFTFCSVRRPCSPIPPSTLTLAPVTGVVDHLSHLFPLNLSAPSGPWGSIAIGQHLRFRCLSVVNRHHRPPPPIFVPVVAARSRCLPPSGASRSIPRRRPVARDLVCIPTPPSIWCSGVGGPLYVAPLVGHGGSKVSGL